MHPALRTFRDELGETFVRLLAYVSGIGVLALVAAKVFGTPAVKAVIEPAPRAEWINVERPFRAFAVTIPDFAEPEPDYATLRHATGGGRRDLMSWGRADGQGARVLSRFIVPAARSHGSRRLPPRSWRAAANWAPSPRSALPR